jgi:hypothetical protein
MNGSNKAATAVAATGTAGVDPVKERIFSIIRKASGEGITDGKHKLWIDFAPHIAVVEKEDSFAVWLWREGVVVKITLDKEFNVLGFDVEVPCR